MYPNHKLLRTVNLLTKALHWQEPKISIISSKGKIKLQQQHSFKAKHMNRLLNNHFKILGSPLLIHNFPLS
jgi:hypothetical protein